ncbi:MAG: hypothetical protein JO205_10760 [Pseudolabrys sp.]|nr:hypothetical protein [Pseudolabrys sp.]
MVRRLLRSLCVAVPVALMGGAALAHDSWVNSGGYKNAAGEWCCGTYDCKAYEKVQSTAQGWVLDGEFVPYDEAMPVAPPDGQVTICRRHDGTRRCVFGLKPSL